MLLRRTRRQGVLRTAGQVLYRIGRGFTRRRQPGPSATWGWLADGEAAPKLPDGLRVCRVADVNGPEAAAFVESVEACATAVYGVSVIRGSVLQALPRPAINLHTGMTTHYRGLHSSFWALSDGRPDLVGYTLHLLDAGLDTGEVVACEAVGEAVVHKSPTLAWIDRHVALAAERKLLGVLESLARGDQLDTVPLESRGKLRSDPTWCQHRRVLKQWKLH